MGIYYEQGAALGEPNSRVMRLKEKRGLNGPLTGHGRHGKHSPLIGHKHFSRLRPEEQLMDMMFMVGGWTHKDPVGSVEQFCPLTNEWRTATSMMHSRGEVAVCSLDGMIYAVGGRDYESCVSNVERYDPNTNLWSNDVASLSSPRSAVTLVELDGYMYALGGHDGISCTNTVERYDPIFDTWTKMTPMRQHRCGAAAVVLDGLLYVIGGTDGETPLDSVERFDPLDGTWQACPPLLCPRESPGCTAYMGRIYVAGGRDELLLELSTVEKFDPEALSWTPVKRMKNKRYQTSLLVFNEMLLAVGGSDGITHLRTIEAYSASTNNWRHFGCMKSSHPGGQVAMLKTYQRNFL